MRALAVTLCLPAALLAQAPPSAPKREDVRALLRVLKTGENAVASMQRSIPAMRQAMPQVPEAFWTAFAAEFTPQRMEDLALPIYEQQLSGAEVKALLAFFATPEGASFARKQPLILEASMVAGQKLGEQVGREVAERLQAEGKL